MVVRHVERQQRSTPCAVVFCRAWLEIDGDVIDVFSRCQVMVQDEILHPNVATLFERTRRVPQESRDAASIRSFRQGDAKVLDGPGFAHVWILAPAWAWAIVAPR